MMMAGCGLSGWVAAPPVAVRNIRCGRLACSTQDKLCAVVQRCPTKVAFRGGHGQGTVASRVILMAKKRSSSRKSKRGEASEAEEEAAVEPLVAETEPEKYKPRGLTMSKQVDEYGFLRPNYSTDSSLPQVVADRMGKRMLVLFSVPFFTGMTGFVTVYLLSIKSEIVVLPSVVATTTLGTFGIALAGVTYGIMSASWDPEEEGTFWGFREFKTNLMRTVEALTTQKKREDAQSRDK